MRIRRLSMEQKEFLLDSLAASEAYGRIQSELEFQLGVTAPSKPTISGYARRYAQEIERRRALWRENLRLSGLPYIHKYERVSHYGMFAKLEIRRRRFGRARLHMRAIAEEMGDLGPAAREQPPSQERFYAELQEIVRAAVERVAGGGG